MVFNIGIDLGTTNSAMAVYDDESESVQMVENYSGDPTTPSVVQVLEDDVIVGKDALANQERYPDRTLARTKRDMGSDTTYEIDGTEYPPERVAGYILQKLKEDAGESEFGGDVDGAVITVPYYFGGSARQATEDAGTKFADLSVYRLMNEPTAACYAYGYQEESDETLFVYDLGGGTFDATLVEVAKDDIDVIDSNGDDELGGENFDDKLYEFAREELVDRGASDPDESKHTKATLRETVKETKEQLSGREDAAIAYQADDFYEVELSRSEFHDLTQDLVDKTISLTEELFDDGDYEVDDVDNVLLVGGSTRMHHVQDAVEEFFGMEPSTDTNPDQVVAKGAALEAAQYDPEGGNLPTQSITDILSHSLGVETHNDDGPNQFDPILEQGADLPSRETKPYGNPDDTEQNLIVNVIQGESDEANHDDNEELGRFVLEDVPGDTKLNVEFTVKEDATLDVTAEAENRDIEGGINISDGIGLTQEEAGIINEDTQDFTSKAVQGREADADTDD
ncbi:MULTISPECIES: Hsp70 family protein [Haloarcula]|uniref:Hsp70 family protein n=1 Tax=Haloarcula TaxID=2237 RepID=UPI0023ED496B|nr:Hsp70 family protein [Halomicroarcula sp. XH51]